MVLIEMKTKKSIFRVFVPMEIKYCTDNTGFHYFSIHRMSIVNSLVNSLRSPPKDFFESVYILGEKSAKNVQ